MTKMAWPCIVCSGALENIDVGATNQPYEGTAFETHGHYGSTFFDPMDGSYLELNVCDRCLTRLTAEGKILFGRDFQPVLCDGSLVGKRRVHRELTIYNGVPGGEEPLNVDREDVGTDAWDTEHFKVEWFANREEVD